MFQFFEFIDANIDARVYADSFESLEVMVNEYGIPLNIAMFVLRPKFKYLIKVEDFKDGVDDFMDCEEVIYFY